MQCCEIGLLVGFMCAVGVADGAGVGEEVGVTVNRARSEETDLATGSVRCFCNLPSCVSTGYMCKSSGGCFSDLKHHASPQYAYSGRHGCLELLTNKDERDWCQRKIKGTGHPMRRKSNHPRSLLFCCYHDMCNHADDPQTKDLINNTALSEIYSEQRGVDSQLEGNYGGADVWFKAATIAVPICGAVILFALIALAIRLLKAESMYGSDYKLGHNPSGEKDKYREHCRAASESLLYTCPNPNYIVRTSADDPRRLVHLSVRKNERPCYFDDYGPAKNRATGYSNPTSDADGK